jgi:Fe-Mn family superoxide dismutase
MFFEVAPLPYPKDALAPAMSARTVEVHYEKHHKGYMAKLKAAIEGTPDADKSLTELIRNASGSVLNNAAQVWNHTFFWQSLKPGGGGPPKGAVAEALERDLGGFARFREAFIDAGMQVFGSGWLWLVLHRNRLRIISTPNALTPLQTGGTPLLAADLWEHAYYLDYENRRDRFLEVFCDELLNWDHVAAQLGTAPREQGTEFADTLSDVTRR